MPPKCAVLPPYCSVCAASWPPRVLVGGVGCGDEVQRVEEGAEGCRWVVIGRALCHVLRAIGGLCC